MRHRIGRTFLCILLVLSMATGAMAASAKSMTDISGHWAKSEITYCVNQGIFNGTSATKFSPNTGMTRGMFVTVLGRMAGVKETSYQKWYSGKLYSDVSTTDYFAPYVVWATRWGIVNGVGGRKFAPNQPITREQMAAIIVRYTEAYNYKIKTFGKAGVSAYSDAASISGYAQTPVETLRKAGLLKGIDNGTTSKKFGPTKTVTRAQCAVVLSRLHQSMTKKSAKVVKPTSVTLNASKKSITVGKTATLTATIQPANATNQKITWVSSAPDVATVEDGKVTAKKTGTAKIYAYTYNGKYKICTVTVKAKAQTATTPVTDKSLGSAAESFEQKCIRIFGQTMTRSNYQYYYASRGSGHVTTVSVPVWQYADSSHTKKVNKTITLTVHKNIATTVQAIFKEIYNGSEQFPIYSAGCYRAGEVSEHGIGVAIDINPNENYQCSNSGTAWTGSYWRPGSDPYSIPVDGDVVRTFRKYGFGWGGVDWNSSHDYMHFSYFGW